MIYNRDQSEVTVLGEVQKYKVGIDERNINHIVTILSSNLYSYPMTSFLRETVSNAVDAHREAGVEEPIIITRANHELSIRDFGTGISPERFREIFLNIGSSTKRESNDYIGSFGIGRFSCLSVADIANITSFYNGKAYYYVMNKDIDQLHIDLLFEKDTDEKNGVEVKIPLEKFNPEDLECLTYIENVFVDSEEGIYEVSRFNKRKIYSYKTFKVCDLRKRDKVIQVLLGKIPYKVDYNALWDFKDYRHKSWSYTFEKVLPTIPIGAVDITPNRESLLYSEKTKTALREAFDAAIEELTALWNLQCSEECENIGKYIHSLTSYYSNELDLNGIKIPISDDLAYNVKYKKYKEWENIPPNDRKNLLTPLVYEHVDMFGRIDGNTIYQGQREQRWLDFRRIMNNWVSEEHAPDRIVLALPSKAGFSSQYFKGFITEKYPDKEILIIRKLPAITVGYVRAFIRKVWGVTTLSNKRDRTFIIQVLHELLLYLKDKIVVTDIVKSPEYEKYKKDHATKKSRVQHTEKILFYVTIPDRSITMKYTCTLDDIVDKVRKDYPDKKHYRVVYSELYNPFTSAFNFMRMPNLVILSVAKGKMKYLKEGLPEWVRPIEELYSADNRVLQKCATLRYIYSQPDIDTSFKPLKAYPESVRKDMEELCKISRRYFFSDGNGDSIIKVVPPEKYDRQILALYNNVKKYLKISHKLMGHYVNDLQYYLLMKAKKLRIDFEFYQNVREDINKLENLL